jgi:hypothetical protein
MSRPLHLIFTLFDLSSFDVPIILRFSKFHVLFLSMCHLGIVILDIPICISHTQTSTLQKDYVALQFSSLDNTLQSVGYKWHAWCSSVVTSQFGETFILFPSSFHFETQHYAKMWHPWFEHIQLMSQSNHVVLCVLQLCHFYDYSPFHDYMTLHYYNHIFKILCVSLTLFDQICKIQKPW